MDCLMWECKLCGCVNEAPTMTEVPTDYFISKCRACGKLAELKLVYKAELVNVEEGEVK